MSASGVHAPWPAVLAVMASLLACVATLPVTHAPSPGSTGGGAPDFERGVAADTVHTLSSRPAFGPRLVVDRAGTATVVWTRKKNYQSAIVAATKTRDGAWSRPEVIGYGTGPQVAADGQGRVTVIWSTHRDGWSDGIRATRRTVQGRWQPPVQLSRDWRAPRYHWHWLLGTWEQDGFIGAFEPRLAVNRKGATVVTWQSGQNNPAARRLLPYRIKGVSRTGGAPWARGWSAPVDLTGPTWAENRELVFGPRRTVVALFESYVDGWQARRHVTGLGWTRTESLHRGGDGPPGEGRSWVGWDLDWSGLDVGGGGRALLVTQDDLANLDEPIDATVRKRGGHWSAWTNIATGVHTIEISPATRPVLFTPDGGALVAWTAWSSGVDSDGPPRAYLARRGPRGVWHPPAAIEGADAIAVLTDNQRGDVLRVTWTEVEGFTGSILFTASDDWTTPFPITSDFHGRASWPPLVAALHAGGGVEAVWVGSDRRLRARQFPAF